MKRFLIGLVLLSGCAVDQQSAALRDCRHTTFQKFYEGRYHGGAFLAGALGGVVGGIAGGALDSATSTNTMQLSDIQPAIDRCVAERRT